MGSETDGTSHTPHTAHTPHTPHTPPPALLLINYEYPPLGGGAGNATYYLARGFAGLGSRVAVLTSRFRGQPRWVTCEGVEVFRVPVARRRRDRCTPVEMLTFIASAGARVSGIARRFRPDAALAFMGIPSGPVAWWLRRRCGVPYLVLLRGGDVPGFLPEELATYHRLTRPFLRRIWRDAAAIVANSEGLRRVALRNMPGFSLEVIPNGVDTERFSPQSAVRSPEPSTLNPQPSTAPKRLLFVGRLSGQKDLPTLLRALGGLPGAPAWELWMAGDGPERERLAALAAQGDLSERVRFLGWTDRERLPELYREADLFVLPSRDEGMPNALLEAMASGLPVVATAVAGSEELVESGKTGYLVPPGRADLLAERIADLLNDAERRRAMGQAARAAVAGRDWTAVARAYLELVTDDKMTR